MAKSKATTTAKEPKAPRTVKVITLVKIGLAIAALAASFIAGGYTERTSTERENAKVNSKVEARLAELKPQEQ